MAAKEKNERFPDRKSEAVAAPTGRHVRRDDIAVSYLGSLMYFSLLAITAEESLFTTCR